MISKLDKCFEKSWN